MQFSIGGCSTIQLRTQREHSVVTISGLYFVIARGDQARFVRPDPDNGLHTVGSADLANLRQNDLAATNTGDPPGLAQIRFGPRLARRINEDLAVDLFTHLVLVAPVPLLQELMDLIDAATTASLFGSLARDLMTIPDLELWPHLLPWLRRTEGDGVPPVCSREW
jgi:hypothetical protein